MRKGMKACAALLVFTLLAAAFAGCGGDNGGATEINLEIDLANKPTIRALFPSSGKNDDDTNNDYNAKVIEQITGYRVQYSQLPAGDESSLALQLIDRTPYEVMKITRDQFNDLMGKQALLDIKPAIDKYGKVMKQVISPESWEVVTVDGGIYGIPERASSDNIEKPIVFRQDWLDKYNLRMPATKEEFKSVLKTLKEKIGANDSSFYPLTFDKFSPLVYAISPAFGIYTDWQEADGSLKYYLENPAIKDYVDFMGELYREKLIDPEIITNDSAKSINKFTQGKAAAVATSLWSIPAIVEGLKANGVINEVQSKGELTDVLGYLRCLKNPDGEYKVFRNSGFTYITVVPHYMAENAAYVVDWIDNKLKDEEGAYNFRNIVIGEENVHFTVSGDSYVPIAEKFPEKDSASFYLTGSNELVYTKYWLARVRKNVEMYRAWTLLMKNADDVGVYSPLDFAPPIAEYASKRATLDIKAQDAMYIMIGQDNSSKNYDTHVNDWKSTGGTKAAAEVNKWYAGRG